MESLAGVAMKNRSEDKAGPFGFNKKKDEEEEEESK
jgi:hypothetical protein